MVRSSYSDLSGLLWRERDLLDLLLGRLVDGSDDTDGLFRSLSSLELHRAILAREAGVELGLDGEPTLANLVACGPGDWTEVLDGHLQALRRLASEVNGRLARPEPVDGNGVVRTQRQSLQRSLQEFLG